MNVLKHLPLALAFALAAPLTACDDGGEDTKTDDAKKDDKAADKKDDKAADKKDDKAADKKDDKAEDKAAPAAGGDAPKEGDKCEGIDKNDGLIACDGNKVIFCSSYSKYVWTKQNECAEGQTCHAEGKSAGCK